MYLLIFQSDHSFGGMQKRYSLVHEFTAEARLRARQRSREGVLRRIRRPKPDFGQSISSLPFTLYRHLSQE